MPSYKLCHFDMKAYAEMIRLLFAEAGVEYEDIRYSYEEWPNHKSDMFFGQVPVLFVDGEQIAHSRAALRYLAREFKLDGGSPLNSTKMDMWLEVLAETFQKLPLQEKDQEKQRELFPSAFKDHVIPKLFQLQDVITANEGTYIFGAEPSALDFAIYSSLEILKNFCGDQILEAAPKVKEMFNAIEARPRIAKWLAERPDTEH